MWGQRVLDTVANGGSLRYHFKQSSQEPFAVNDHLLNCVIVE